MQSEVNEELTSVNLQQSSKGGGFDAKGEEKEKFLEAGGAEGGEGRGFRWVIYRDFKASNILLDKDFRAKLSDFGLAREGPTEGNTHVSTAVVGTHGYAAPDYIQTGHLTVKSDVWSFGVVLYEILTGRRTLDRNRPQGEQKLLEWVSQFSPDSRNFRMIMDPKLRGEYSVKAAREIAKLADSCLLKNAKERPTMSEVVEVLRRAEQAQAEPASGDRAHGAGKGKRVDVAASSRS